MQFISYFNSFSQYFYVHGKRIFNPLRIHLVMLVVNSTIRLRMGTKDNFLASTKVFTSYAMNRKIIPKVHKSQYTADKRPIAHSPNSFACRMYLRRERGPLSSLLARITSPLRTHHQHFVFLCYDFPAHGQLHKSTGQTGFIVDSPCSATHRCPVCPKSELGTYFFFSPIDKCKAALQCA